MMTAIALSLLVATAFPLEWNSTFPACEPYEIEVSPEKLQAGSFDVKADGRSLPVKLLPGRTPGSLFVRFAVPEGTAGLECTTLSAKAEVANPVGVDNLFAGASSDVRRWKLEKGVRARSDGDSVLFETVADAADTAWVSCDVAVPGNLAGRSVRQEFTLANRSPLVWGGYAQIDQYDAKGRKLPETVADYRWTSHLRPVGESVRYCEMGRIHPRAVRLRARFALRRCNTEHDGYGLPVKDKSSLNAALHVSALVVRPANELPFPKWNDAFFGKGVSGAPGDTSLKLGGADGIAFFYQTHSRGAWSGGHQFKKEEDLLFPSGAGTVEAWFRPDWSAFRAAEAPLFEAYHGRRIGGRDNGRGRSVYLGYRPEKGVFSVFFCDAAGKVAEKTSPSVPDAMPDGVWTHVALQWKPGGTAEVFVGGRKVLSFPIAQIGPFPLDKGPDRNLNDARPQEFYFGGTSAEVRLRKPDSGAKGIIFEGEGDLLRVSTGLRYGDGFVPARKMSSDAATRALFSFDRRFDGVSGGGFGFVRACVVAKSDRVEHRLGEKWYWPEHVTSKNDPGKVLDPLNYKKVPSVDDFRLATVRRTATFGMKPGDKVKVHLPPRARMEYAEISNASGTEKLVHPVLVVRGRADPRSPLDLADSFALGEMSQRGRVETLFRYVLGASDYFMNTQADFSPGSDVPHVVIFDPMTMLNGYCGFECGPLNNMAACLFAISGKAPAVTTYGYGHMFQEVFYDGKNHVYDLSAQSFFPAMDNETAAYLEEIGDQPGIMHRTFRSPDHFMRKGTRTLDILNAGYCGKFAITLNPGETLRVWTANDGQMNNLQSYRKTRAGNRGRFEVGNDERDYGTTAGADTSEYLLARRDRVFPHYANGFVTFDAAPSASNPAFERIESGSFCYRVRNPYPIVWGEYRAVSAGGGEIPLEISTDGGTTFRPLPRRSEYLVKARHDYLVRVKAPIGEVKRFTATTECMVNSRIFPSWLSEGDNEVVFKATGGGAAKTVLAWREPAKEMVICGGVYSGTIPGFERQLAVLDPAETLELPVKGAGPGASARCSGPVRASISGGMLRVSYDPSGERLILRGGDNPEPQQKFPAVAEVVVSDGGAEKFLTLVVSPDARLVTASQAEPFGGAELKGEDSGSVQARLWCTKKGAGANFPCRGLKKGMYSVFALARFPGGRRCPAGFRIVSPAKNGKSWNIARIVNPAQEFLKAGYAYPGERSRWNWDCANREDWQKHDHNGWSMRSFEAPDSHYTLRLTGDCDGAELAALLVVPEPDIDTRNDLRKLLFGLNCAPARMKGMNDGK